MLLDVVIAALGIFIFARQSHASAIRPERTILRVDEEIRKQGMRAYVRVGVLRGCIVTVVVALAPLRGVAPYLWWPVVIFFGLLILIAAVVSLTVDDDRFRVQPRDVANLAAAANRKRRFGVLPIILLVLWITTWAFHMTIVG